MRRIQHYNPQLDLMFLYDISIPGNSYKDGRPCITLDEDHQAYDHIAPMFLAWLSQYSKYKQGELSQDNYDNWRYNFPNIQPTAGFVRNPISDELDVELQKTLNKEMKKRGLL